MESTLAQLVKVRTDGRAFLGGPAHYIQKGLGSRPFAVAFAGLLLACFPFAFNSLQVNTISVSMSAIVSESAQGWVPFVVGVVIAGLVALVVFGGLHRITGVSQTVMPIVAFAYLMVGIIILVSTPDLAGAPEGVLLAQGASVRSRPRIRSGTSLTA